MIWQVLLGDISIRVSLYYHFQYIQAATERFPDDRKGDCCNSWKDEVFYNKLWNSGITAISSISFSSYTSIDANTILNTNCLGFFYLSFKFKIILIYLFLLILGFAAVLQFNPVQVFKAIFSCTSLIQIGYA